MKEDIINTFGNEYKDITTPLLRNYELTEAQSVHIKTELEMIYKNIVNDTVIYTSDYRGLQMLLRDLQFYEYINRRENNEKESETSK